MAVATIVLMETAALTAGSENATTPQGTRFLLDKVITYASTTGTVVAKVVPAGATVGATHVLASKSFAVGEAYTWPEITGTTLMNGDTISLLPSAGMVCNARISGRSAT